MFALAWWADVLVFRTWWSYHPGRQLGYWDVYHTFNLFEGTVWFIFAGLVIRRSPRIQDSPLEIAYALAFFTFGLTDFREAYALQSWLIWVKLVNLIVLLTLRARVLKRYDPSNRLY